MRIFWIAFVLTVTVGVALLTAYDAKAQEVCGDRDEMLASLSAPYKEQLSGIGLPGNSGTNGVVELYTSESGNFTLLYTQPNGVSCLITMGNSWENIPVVKPSH